MCSPRDNSITLSSPESGGKMAFTVTVLLLAVGVFSCTDAQEAYSKLSEPYGKGVDLALKQLNNHSAIQHHFLFFKSLLQSDINVSETQRLS